MASFAGATTIPPTRLATDAAAPGSLPVFAISKQDAFVAGAATGAADPGAQSVYESYYGPAPLGLQGTDVMSHIARTNLTLPAYYQVKFLTNCLSGFLRLDTNIVVFVYL